MNWKPLVPIGVAFVMVFSAVPLVQAQGTVRPTSKIGWNQPAATLADAQALQYAAYVDAGTSRTALVGVICAGAAGTLPPPPGTFACVAPFPALLPGPHTLTLTAAQVVSGAVVDESLKSPLLSFVFVVISAPQDLRIIVQ